MNEVSAPAPSWNRLRARCSRSLSTTSSQAVAFTPQRVGLDHLSFAVSDRAELEAWQARLDELGIEHDAIDDQGFAVALNLRDPDGIALEFYFLQRRGER